MRVTTEQLCAVVGCHRRARVRGWCNTHYERWRLGREVDFAGDLRSRPRPKGRCKVEGCDRERYSRGFCTMHYTRWRAKGDPGGPEPIHQYGAKRHVTVSGYIRVWAPDHALAHSDGYIFEHRKVLYDAGVTIPTGWHVHHRNHDRGDNRLVNLDVLSPKTHAQHHAKERRS